MDKVNEYFNGDMMASHAWQDKYQMKNSEGIPVEETPADMHKRMAKEFARIEYYYKKIEGGSSIGQEGWDSLSIFGRDLFKKRVNQLQQDIEDELFNYFDKFNQIVPQGSIMSNLGNIFVFGSLSNCFVIAPPEDSYGGIMKADEELAQLMKRRGGVGTNLNNLRPSQAAVTNSAKSSSGVDSFMSRFSNTTREVAQEGRRGALMLLLSCQHPDIFKFVSKKDDRTQVTGANISVMFTDYFLECVEKEQDFLCCFPIGGTVIISVDEFNSLEYNKIVSIVSKQYVMKIHAKELFDLVVEMAHKNAEPGVLYIDRVYDYSPDGVYPQYKAIATNPCGEQAMPANDTCRLIALNFFGIVDNPFTEEATINYDRLYEISYIQQRLGDDLVDLELEYIDRILDKIQRDPESEDVKRVERELWTKIRKIAKDGRRTGNGFTALGDMLASLLKPYFSPEIVESVMKTKMEAELDCTIDMAILRGTFTGWDAELEKVD